MSFIADGHAIQAQLVRIRRLLHQDPEVGLDLPMTQALVLAELKGLGLEITRGRSSTSVTAVLRGAKPGRTVLLRGDMDALPIREDTGLDFASTNGSMHACGHDLHTAALVGAARILSRHRATLQGNVIFMFQPGEEGHGGALAMLQEGVLQATGEHPIAAFAIHAVTGARGIFHVRSGPTLAGSNELRVTITGAGGHAAKPHHAVDPVPAIAELVTALQTMATRRFSVFDPVVITVTQLEAGDAMNIIPASARLGASVRTLSDESTKRVAKEAKRLADGIAAAHNCLAQVIFDVQNPVTYSDPETTRKSAQALREMFGTERVAMERFPDMPSEDFSYVLKEVPGTFITLSCTPEGVDAATAANNHSGRVLFDDAVLGDQAAALAQLAWSTLEDASAGLA